MAGPLYFHVLFVAHLFEECLLNPRVNERLASKVMVKGSHQRFIAKLIRAPVPEAALVPKVRLHPPDCICRA